MVQKVDLKSVAKQFGMNISAFAQFVGYSKQALYQINDGTNGICTPRYHAALKLLKFQSDQIYQEELKEVKQKKIEREKAILQLCKNVGAINVVPDWNREDG